MTFLTARLGASLAVFAISFPAVALDSMQCGSRLVSVGDSQQEVLDICGQPDATSGLVQTNHPPPITPVGPQGVELNPNVVWIYSAAPGRMSKSLTFEGGALRVIRTGP